MKIYTTSQVAKLLKVAPRTVSKWYDAGRLKGYRIPGSQDRRIPRGDLEEFCREHGMPCPDDEPVKVQEERPDPMTTPSPVTISDEDRNRAQSILYGLTAWDGSKVAKVFAAHRQAAESKTRAAVIEEVAAALQKRADELKSDELLDAANALRDGTLLAKGNTNGL